jgi:integrase
MASVIKLTDRKTGKPNGRRAVQFADLAGERRTIRLGKVSQDDAEEFGRNVDALVAAKAANGEPSRKILEWGKGLGEALVEKLAKYNVVASRSRVSNHTLGTFLDDWFAKKTRIKGSTATIYGHTRRCLINYFGENKPLAELTPGDADDWREWLASDQELAGNTVRRRCGIAKQFFKAAVRKELIRENPFADLSAAMFRNEEKFYFVTREEAQAVLDACPDAQWRLLFALSRFGGLRCPSEHLGLRWADVDWARDRITIHSPKTEHQGKGSRQIPIFPELRPYLEDAFDPESEHVITRYREGNVNLRTQLLRIIAKASLKPWPKLFQNLRSTRETELAKDHPLHVVCAWIGNTQAVAAKHYLQVTDADYQKAAGRAPEALQNALHQYGMKQCNPVKQKRETGTIQRIAPVYSTPHLGEWAHTDSNCRPRPYQGQGPGVDVF